MSAGPPLTEEFDGPRGVEARVLDGEFLDDWSVCAPAMSQPNKPAIAVAPAAPSQLPEPAPSPGGAIPSKSGTGLPPAAALVLEPCVLGGVGPRGGANVSSRTGEGMVLEPAVAADRRSTSATVGSRGWSPGVDTKGWLGRDRPVDKQTLVQ